MGRFGRFAPGIPNKVEHAKFENKVREEIQKQVANLRAQMEEKYENDLRASYIAIRRIYEQYQADVASIALNDLGWGKTRINRFLDKWDEIYNTYLDALTAKDEADYLRVRLDERLQAISKDEVIPPFEERYSYLPEIKYEIKTNTNEESEDEKENNG